jgi:hypothetical protein
MLYALLCRKLIRPITVVAALTMAGGVHAAESMVFATLRAGGLAIGGDIFFNSRSEQLAALTLRHAVPTIYQIPYWGLKT